MVSPLRSKGNHSQVSKETSLPAPVKGWFVGTGLSESPPGTAYALDNAFPQLDYVRARKGCLAFATGLAGSTTVHSLMTWTNGLVSKMFAASNGNIYDTSLGGAVGAAAVAGLNTSALVESIQFTGSGGTFLICVNGQDPVQIYTGAAWQTTPAITGLTGNPLAQIWAYKSRIYGIERDTLNAWYLPIDSIGGAATKFPLTSIFKLGGSLLCGATWAIDSTSGIYETCVFITTEGEVAVYNGPYPGDPAWTLIGTYKISRPLGRRCLMRAGGDLGIMTEDGIVPMSKVETLDQVALQNAAVTAPIAPAWRSAVIDRAGIGGWQIVIWPLESMGIINLPKQNAGDYTQFVANVRTGAWARYIGWDANCFCVFNNQLYFGSSDGRVMQGEIGGQDDGRNYTTTIFPSFNDGGVGPSRKQIRFVRPMYQTNLSLNMKVTINVDYDTTIPSFPAPSSTTIGIAKWGIAIWGVDVWPAAVTAKQDWLGAYGFGSALSPIIQVTFASATAPNFRLVSTTVIYEEGNIFG